MIYERGLLYEYLKYIDKTRGKMTNIIIVLKGLAE